MEIEQLGGQEFMEGMGDKKNIFIFGINYNDEMLR